MDEDIVLATILHLVSKIEPYSFQVILATNIAETSVTIPGVRYVVDCGLLKAKAFVARLGLASL